MSDYLKKEGDEIAECLKDGKTGPTRAASRVMRLAIDWEVKYRKQVGGIACTTWLRRRLGRGVNLTFFEKRHLAAEHFGGQRGRALFMDHSALLWAYSVFKAGDEDVKVKDDKVKDDKQKQKAATNRKAFDAGLDARWLENVKQPLSLAQTKLVFEKVVGKAPTRAKAACLNCVALQAEVDRLRALVK